MGCTDLMHSAGSHERQVVAVSFHPASACHAAESQEGYAQGRVATLKTLPLAMLSDKRAYIGA